MSLGWMRRPRSGPGAEDRIVAARNGTDAGQASGAIDFDVEVRVNAPTADLRKGTLVLLQLGVHGVGERCEGMGAVDAGDLDKLLGVWHGERAQEKRVHHGEDRDG
jgi:hypothetical protein